MIYLRSLLFYLGMLVSLILMLPVLLILAVFPVEARYRLLTRWGRFMLWWLQLSCNLDYRIHGQENVPDGPAIILAKHQSAWETLAMQQIFPRQTWLMKKSLLKVPIFGWGLALLQVIAIDRGASRQALRQLLEQGGAALERGVWVVIFPEGTRIRPGARGKYNVGGALLAQKTGYPIVPVAHNAGCFWRRNSLLKHAGTIDLVIGPVIEPADCDAQTLNRRAEEWIENTVKSLPCPEI